MIQKFIIEGNPRGQGRPRACKRGRHAGIYEAKEDTMFKQNLAAQVVMQKPEYIDGKPIVLTAQFYLPRPKSHYDSKGRIKERYADVSFLGKPDLSNLIKALEDALNGIVWSDDSLIVGYGMDTGKYYADTRPHTVVEVFTQ